MANTVTNVSAGKPNVNGAIYYGALTETAPTNAHSSLSAFTAVGYVSDSGLVNSNSMSTTDIKAWGGDTVLNIQESKDDKFTFTLIEVLNADVLKAVYGSANVSGSLGNNLTVQANSDEPDELMWVIDMVMRGGVLKRIVIPDAKISEIGDISYTDTDAVGYEITLTCFPDSTGNTHYEYFEEESES